MKSSARLTVFSIIRNPRRAPRAVSRILVANETVET